MGYWETPAARIKRDSILRRLLIWMRSDGRKPEEHKRVNSNGGWGNWAAGWEPAAMPSKKE